MPFSVGKPSHGGKIINQIASNTENNTSPAPRAANVPIDAAPTTQTILGGPVVWLSASDALQRFAYPRTSTLSEDQVKAAVKQALDANGWQTEVHYGHVQGIDIEAMRDDERFVLEAKGEGISDQVRGNYFDGALGELLRRMNAPGVRYGLALPAHRRFAGLVERLPLWVRHRLGLWFFFVRPMKHGLEVGVLPPNESCSSL